MRRNSYRTARVRDAQISMVAFQRAIQMRHRNVGPRLRHAQLLAHAARADRSVEWSLDGGIALHATDAQVVAASRHQHVAFRSRNAPVAAIQIYRYVAAGISHLNISGAGMR